MQIKQLSNKELIFEYNLSTDFNKRAGLLHEIEKNKVSYELKKELLDLIKSSKTRSEKIRNYRAAAEILEKVQQDLIWETGISNGKLWYIEVSEMLHRFKLAAK